MSRVVLVLALTLALGVAACGRKGELEPPPQRLLGVPAHDAAVQR